MNDTSPEIEQMYREMLLQRSGAERLKMGCSMFATARALVVASVLEKEPSASPARVRPALFLRFYGADFDARERERITARLARDDEERQPVQDPETGSGGLERPGNGADHQCGRVGLLP